jgi:hypothetical protein
MRNMPTFRFHQEKLRFIVRRECRGREGRAPCIIGSKLGGSEQLALLPARVTTGVGL